MLLKYTSVRMGVRILFYLPFLPVFCAYTGVYNTCFVPPLVDVSVDVSVDVIKVFDIFFCF